MTRNQSSNESADETSLSPSEQRRAVRQRYATAAAGIDDEGDTDSEGSCGEETTRRGSTCCGESEAEESSCRDDAADASHSRALGYSDDELERVADGANLGLGCGNPNAIAELDDGETVLDLGSGGGFDCFLAAREVGEDGNVIGVDMTPEMVERARANVEKNEVENVEFRLGEIENLPVPDAHVDVVISNCVVNLSPDKRRVFEEAYRVLRPGGRLAIADVVMTAEVPSELRRADPESVAACVAGAATIDELHEILEGAGFESASIRPKEDSEELIREWSDEHSLEDYLVSAVIEAEKPRKEEEEGSK
jgi:ubiquinone/menaquinone biosynthesis C-methylase UbiE